MYHTLHLLYCVLIMLPLHTHFVVLHVYYAVLHAYYVVLHTYYAISHVYCVVLHVCYVVLHVFHCITPVLQEDVVVQVVDGVLEFIRTDMEINFPKYNQRRVCMVKYLGELYNFRLVDSAVIFKTLYSFITFGVSYDNDMPSLLG